MRARDRFVECARAQVGKPYRWGAPGPDAFDCSNLVAFCYEQATGKTITRSSYEQAHLGVSAARGDLQPGDIVCWGHGGNADHVGIYDVANNFGGVINALNEQRGVVRTALDANYDMPYIGARRIFTEGPPEAQGKPDSNGEEGAIPSPSPNPPKVSRPRDRQRKREQDGNRRRRRNGR